MPRIIVVTFLASLFVPGCGNDAPNDNPMGGGSGTGGVGGAFGCFEEVSLDGELGGPCLGGGTTCNTGLDCVPEMPEPILSLIHI